MDASNKGDIMAKLWVDPVGTSIQLVSLAWWLSLSRNVLALSVTVTVGLSQG